MTTPTEDARAALADADLVHHGRVMPSPYRLMDALRALLVEHERVCESRDSLRLAWEDAEASIAGINRALIEPPTDDERDGAYRWWRDEFDNSKGVPSYSDAFDAGWDAVLRRQVSHPEPVTDAVRRIREAVGPAVLHKGGAGAVYEFTPNGTATEFWSYENAVAYSAAVNEILRLLDPNIELNARATTYAGGSATPRTLEEALEAAKQRILATWMSLSAARVEGSPAEFSEKFARAALEAARAVRLPVPDAKAE